MGVRAVHGWGEVSVDGHRASTRVLSSPVAMHSRGGASVKRRRVDALVRALGAPLQEVREWAQAELYRRWQVDPSTESAVAKALASCNVEARRRGCELYAFAPSIMDPSPLIRCLRDESILVRLTAVHALGSHRVAIPSALFALKECASRDSGPVLRVNALAALAVIAPTRKIVSKLCSELFPLKILCFLDPEVHDCGEDIDETAAYLVRLLLRTLKAAGTHTVRVIAPLLNSTELRKNALNLLDACGAPLDPAAPTLIQLIGAGMKSEERTRIIRMLGRLDHPGLETLERLYQLTNDWNAAVRATATVALGQLATRTPVVRLLFVAAIGRLRADDMDHLADALRAAQQPLPPRCSVLKLLATVDAVERLKLAGAIFSLYRAHELFPGVTTDGLELPIRDDVFFEALVSLNSDRHSSVAIRFLELTNHPEAVVRACSAACAAFLDHGIATAIALQRLAEVDDDLGVRAVARALLQELG